MRNVFISDLDDVLLDMCGGLINAIQEEHGIYVPMESWTHFDFRQYPTLNNKQILDVHLKYKLINTLKAFEESHVFLDKLNKNNVDVVIVTSRAWHKEAKEKTFEHLKSLNFKVSDVIVTDHRIGKKDVISSISKNNNVIGFVDDNADNVNSVIDVVDNIYLYNKPWNKKYKNNKIKRVSFLEEIYQDLFG